MASSVPEIPGEFINDPSKLKEKVASLLGLNSYKFPGAQPVSFGAKQLKEIEEEDFFVAEKSDGVRCLALLSVNQRKEPEVYLFDRKNNFYIVRNFRFPIPGDPTFKKCLKNTIIDGEFVLDKEEDGTMQLRFLLFDCLCIEEKVLLTRGLMRRLGYLKSDVIKPHQEMIRKNPHLRKRLPFLVEFKEQQFTHHLDVVFNEIIPKLKHGNDGLIFTSVNAPYSMGTCDKMLKWKPLNENSVDFKVSLTFPGSNLPGVKDFTEKPRIDLLVWQGGNDYQFFAELGITDQEWRKQFGDKPKYMDGKIIECNYDPEIQQRLQLKSPWRFMRYRNDKSDGNHQSTVDNVIRSIRDAVTKEELIECMPRIKEACLKRKQELDDRQQTKKIRQD
ncbi:mRNA-capping enzyme subunit alpha [Cokeromyces recurvatus]|uniref:mRNA-capping enzyme subunit alpha n=1 Tax=Cokeromyces recurvatus TaxID=90255 RepID=UPI002220442C|nr:mRNA-capping enzyme subunit alpha [Cokeromyces recurvatus]KAI7907459.1 mRNA-capping enzyme subunit alpha [Cokeromyces recurvatus]